MSATAIAKSNFAQTAAKNNVETSFSGKNNTMFIKGDDKHVKSFIRICNLKGKGFFGFQIKQG